MEMKWVAYLCLSISLLSALLSNATAFGNVSPVKYTWVSVAGEVSAYGSHSAQGWIRIFADVGYWADGGCAFTVPPLETEDILIHPAPPFNFTLYFTKIMNAYTVGLAVDSYDLLIAGVWGIGNVTDPDSAMDISGISENMIMSFGELSVTESWTHFTISLDGYESVRGNITYYCVREIETEQKKYPYGDINYDFRINMRDIGAFACAFGSPLGYERYNFLADVDLDLKTDIKDVAICAKHFGMIY